MGLKTQSTLYVSDLDGTLLNNEKSISSYTAKVINDGLRKGYKFAIATARFPYACDHRLEELDLSLPGIVINGVMLYNFDTGQFPMVHVMDKQTATEVLGMFKDHKISPFLYLFKDDQILIYFEDEASKAQTQYYSDRALEFAKTVERVDDLKQTLENGDPFYLAVTGDRDQLKELNDALVQSGLVATAFYLNIYDGSYCLEVFSKKASKKNAIGDLKKFVDFDELVVFGDNLNDLAMFSLADRSYATGNALPEVKEKATAVIGSNNEDGVAKKLASEWNLSEDRGC